MSNVEGCRAVVTAFVDGAGKDCGGAPRAITSMTEISVEQVGP